MGTGVGYCVIVWVCQAGDVCVCVWHGGKAHEEGCVCGCQLSINWSLTLARGSLCVFVRHARDAATFVGV